MRPCKWIVGRFFTALLQRAGTCLSGGDVLVPEADVLRFEDLSVGHFAAGDNVQLVHGLHHSPARREREIKNNRFMTNMEGKKQLLCYSTSIPCPISCNNGHQAKN